MSNDDLNPDPQPGELWTDPSCDEWHVLSGEDGQLWMARPINLADKAPNLQQWWRSAEADESGPAYKIVATDELDKPGLPPLTFTTQLIRYLLHHVYLVRSVEGIDDAKRPALVLSARGKRKLAAAGVEAKTEEDGGITLTQRVTEPSGQEGTETFYLSPLGLEQLAMSQFPRPTDPTPANAEQVMLAAMRGKTPYWAKRRALRLRHDAEKAAIEGQHAAEKAAFDAQDEPCPTCKGHRWVVRKPCPDCYSTWPAADVEIVYTDGEPHGICPHCGIGDQVAELDEDARINPITFTKGVDSDQVFFTITTSHPDAETQRYICRHCRATVQIPPFIFFTA